MKIVLTHDVRILKKDKKYFSTGGLNNITLERYKKYFDFITIISRETESEDADTSKLTELSLENIKIESTSSIINLIKRKEREKIKKLVSENDAVIALIPSTISFLTIYYAKKLKKPYVLEMITCSWDALWNHSIKGKVLAPLMWLITKKTISEAKYCIYVTEKFFQKRYPTKGKQLGLSDVVIYDNSEEILQKRIKKITLKNENEKIIMGTLGVINANYKGQQFVIEALAKLNNPNYEYQIVGPGDKTFLLNKAKEFNVENQVKFVGTLSHEEIFDWLDSVDIYIQPSLAEGLPRSLVEAMSRGCTCLGSDVGGIPELLNEKSLFEKKNVIELSEKIKNLSSEKMLEQAKLNFEKSKKFDPKNLEEKRDKFYNEFKKECMTLKK